MFTPDPQVFDEYNRLAERDRWPSRVDPALAFEAPELREALAVWRKAAGDRALPLRAVMTPRLMKRFLAQVAVLDIVRAAGRTRFRVRVTGTALERTFGGMTGMFLDETLSEPFRSRWEATLLVALRAGSAVRSVGRVEFRDQTYLKAETFYGPMGDDIAAPDSMLVIVHTETTKAPATPVFRTPASASSGA
jgi:PAS domain